jgi:hypothetical protein
MRQAAKAAYSDHDWNEQFNRPISKSVFDWELNQVETCSSRRVVLRLDRGEKRASS